ncbi:hypothetical protein C8A03DRAFT_15757 [Achaetomium macrosporum]|uniref:Uncharacterized protein n=1 Tax=Achaetomium macrosporum TaxID=79813 RepID=A0AAN7HF14_9PEZI|nr:hypothetical protein C8A03DRAFT_15757 [Achaetomium macrosporum]
MCLWEEFIYAECQHPVLKRMAYSCDIYSRYVYGECRFDNRRDRNKVSKVFYIDGYCPKCQELYQYVNL